MSVIELSFDCGESTLSVHRFSVHEGISTLFGVTALARSPDPDLDLRAIVGRPASLRLATGYRFAAQGGARLWTGICSRMDLVHAGDNTPGKLSLSTYALRIVPDLWLLTQRRGFRIFQHLSIPDIVDRLLAEWQITPTWRIARPEYPRLEYKVQYGETDYDFMSRLLEEAGICFTFPDDDREGSRVTFWDTPTTAAPRGGGPLPFVDSPGESAEMEYVTQVRLATEVRPGAHATRDYDFRSPAARLLAEAPRAAGPEARYEQFDYEPGGFLIEVNQGGGTPVADDRGIARYEMAAGQARALRAQRAARVDRRSVEFSTNTIDLWPGVGFFVSGHPHPDIDAGTKLFVTTFGIDGSPDGEWAMTGRATPASEPYVPARRTAKPIAEGVQSATVVGPAGQEIHTDEFGRVRVQFPWDREGKGDEKSSPWIRVSQGWGGAGYGLLTLPRVGQEVLVGFLEGDPEQPVVVGRVYNAVEPVPYRLPERKTESTWRSESSPGGEGFNEIRMEDLASEELLSVQAEKNLRKLVKNDETITVVHDRIKNVEANETDTTNVNRLESTGVDRKETTWGNRTTIVGANRRKRVMKDETERTERQRLTLVMKDAHHWTAGTKRELIEKTVHLLVKGSRRERIVGTQSLTVMESQREKVGKRHALETGKRLHVKAREAAVGEGGKSVTAKGPGGFLRIDAQGVTLAGTRVRINAGGTAGKGKGSHPELPEEPEVARVEPPDLPPNVALPGEGERCVVAPAWSKPRAAVGETVYATFVVRAFAGGEAVTVTVLEQDDKGGQKQVATLAGVVTKSDGRVAIPWERDEDEIEAKLVADDGQARVQPLEYRFEVVAGGIKAEGDSGPLWLTKTIVADLVEVEASADGEEERKLPPDGTRVTVTGADGAARTATTKDGIARVHDIVVGPRIRVKVEAPEGAAPGTIPGGDDG